MQAPHYCRLPDGRTHINGLGLCGCLLALHLYSRKRPFIVYDRQRPGRSSEVAPGILNPLAGRKYRPVSNLDRLLVQMQSAVQLAETTLDSKLWQATPLLRVFPGSEEAARFRENQSSAAPYIVEVYPPDTFPHLKDSYGSFLTASSGWLDLPGLLGKTQQWLSSMGLLAASGQSAPHPADLSPTEVVVDCTGWQIARNPLWSFLPHNPAKGEMLTVRFEGAFPRSHLINQNCWLQALPGDSLWKVGATYSWKNFDDKPGEEAELELKQRLSTLTEVPYVKMGHVAAVRPILADSFPVVGRHPEWKQLYILGGMGSKGVLHAPSAVKLLLDGIPSGHPWTVNRFV